jgi:hypothetical protein
MALLTALIIVESEAYLDTKTQLILVTFIAGYKIFKDAAKP